MRILIDEEFGYRFWIWEPTQKTAEELTELWTSLDPSAFETIYFNPPKGLGGVWTEIHSNDSHFLDLTDRQNYDGNGHIHTYEDSYLNIGGKELTFPDPYVLESEDY